jgi:hypothetical protein
MFVGRVRVGMGCEPDMSVGAEGTEGAEGAEGMEGIEGIED